MEAKTANHLQIELADGENQSMSVKCIDLIIRQHTGANASDTVKITHAEVMAMIRCAGEPSKIAVGDRAQLMAALEMFGGNEIHPDIFSSPEDKAALAKTAMEGIETAEKFSTLTPGSQAAFIWKCLIVGSGNTVGFTRVLGMLLISRRSSKARR